MTKVPAMLGRAAASVAASSWWRASRLPEMLVQRRMRWTATTFQAPPAPPPPPGPKEKLVVLFPRQGSRQTSIEVKRRIIRSTPHMGGRRLKEMVRKHARYGKLELVGGQFKIKA